MKKVSLLSKKTLLALSLTGALSAPAYAATEIQFWHAMSGPLGERVNAIAEGFNKSQPDYKIVPVFKGSYPETLSAGIAAYRAKSQPAILQVFEVGTATMINSKGAIKPVQELMKDQGTPLDNSAFIQAVASYYSDSDGNMISMPFNSSTVVFYYNKDAFTKAGLDPNAPPKTWDDFAVAAKKLKESGATACPYTTGWPGWVHLETFSTWHNMSITSHNNGFDGLDARFGEPSPLQIKHMKNLADWGKAGLFVYAGRVGAEAEAKFATGECAMLTSSSGARAMIDKTAKFKYGISTVPYYANVDGAPQNTIIGGASLWVMSGKSAEEYKGVSKFFTYLSQPELQAEWHQATGYLPVTMAAYELTKKSGFYEKNPGANVAVEQMIVKVTDKSRGLRLGNMPQIRDIFAEEMEQMLVGKNTPEQALATFRTRANDVLEKFQKSVK